MLLKVFNNKNRFLQFLLIALSFTSVFLLPIKVVTTDGFNPLYNIFISIIGDNQITIHIVFYFLIVIPIILTQYFATVFGVLKRNYFHFLFLAPLFIFSNSNAWSINPTLFALIFFVIGLSNLFQLNRTENPIVISSTAFIFSIASLFYSLFIWNIFLIIAALFIFREFKIREFLMIIGSFILPYIYIFTWFFVNDNLLINWTEFSNQVFKFSFNISIDNTIVQIGFAILIIGLSIYLLISIIRTLQNKLIQLREYILFFIVAFFFSIMLLFIAGTYTSYQYILIQFLIAFLYSLQLGENKPKWYHDIVILLIIVHNIFSVLYA